MSIFNDIVDDIKLTLSGAQSLSTVKFINSDINDTVPNPIRNTYVSMGIYNIDIKGGAFNSYIGMGKTGEQYGNNADVEIELKIFSPKEKGGKECYAVFSKIYEQLLYHEENYNIKSVSCSKTEYNSDIFSFELACKISMNVYIGYETDEININSINVKKRT